MNITGRRLPSSFGQRRLRDFVTTPGEHADLDGLIQSPQVSLFCLEDEIAQAVFVEMPEGVDLSKAPFVFESQYRYAVRLFTVPYATFLEVAQHLPPLRRLIMVYMTGRSGSTLFSHALNQLDSVMSFSEPAALGQFVYLEPTYRGREWELSTLLQATMGFVCKAAPGRQITTYAVKPAIETVQAFNLFHSCFPQAKNLFLYRDAVDWVSSMFHHLQAAWWPPEMTLDEVVARGRTLCNVDPRPLLTYLEEGATSITTVEGLTLVWLGLMQEYLDLRTRNMPILAVRYADMVARPKQLLQQVFEYCDLLPAWHDGVLKVFDSDAQAGTALRRVNPKEGNKVRFTPEQLDRIRAILQRHPVLKRTDVMIP